MIQIVALDYGFITRLVFSKLQATAIVHAARNYYHCAATLAGNPTRQAPAPAAPYPLSTPSVRSNP